VLTLADFHTALVAVFYLINISVYHLCLTGNQCCHQAPVNGFFEDARVNNQKIGSW
jgi:hypothetical protein